MTTYQDLIRIVDKIAANEQLSAVDVGHLFTLALSQMRTLQPADLIHIAGELTKTTERICELTANRIGGN